MKLSSAESVQVEDKGHSTRGVKSSSALPNRHRPRPRQAPRFCRANTQRETVSVSGCGQKVLTETVLTNTTTVQPRA